MARWDHKDKRIKNDDWLKYHYIDLKWSANKIARELGYKPSSITYRLKKLGIVLRDKYERVPRGDSHPNKEPERRKHFSDINRGKTLPDITKQRISNTLSDPNITKWELLKEETKKVFRYKCFICGTKEVECKQNLQLHHINYKPHNYYINNNNYNITTEKMQLILVCSSCHTTIHFHTFEYYQLLSNFWANENSINFDNNIIIEPIFNTYTKISSNAWKDKEWMYSMYIEHSFPARIISDIAGCSTDRIYDWLKIHNIPIRSHSEAKKCKPNIYFLEQP